MAQDQSCAGGHEGKYSSDIHLDSFELDGIVKKGLNIRNFEHKLNIMPSLIELCRVSCSSTYV